MMTDGQNLKYQTEIQAMMYTSGDVRNPLSESSALIEAIVKQELQRLTRMADQVASLRKAKHFSPSDLMFVIREDKIKLQRIKEFLSWKDVRKNAKNDEDYAEDERTEKVKVKNIKLDWDLIDSLNQSNEMSESEDLTDGQYMHRLKDADRRTKEMSRQEYIEYSECRQASFTYKKAKRFRDWLEISSFSDMKLNDDVIDIYGFLASELVDKIVEQALIIKNQKQNNAKESKKTTLKRKIGLFSWPAMKRPIKPEHIKAAMRKLTVSEDTGTKFLTAKTRKRIKF